MKVLIACEFSGVVREAFRARGHEAYSCDLLPSEVEGPHLISDAIQTIKGWPYYWDPLEPWGLVIAFPPCTHLAVSGARWFKNKKKEQKEAIEFVEAIWTAGDFPMCIENPVGVLSTQSILGKPTQIIQPWQFGHGGVKPTCLWLKHLPLLTPTNIVGGRVARVHREPPSPDRWKNRSRMLPNIAAAMADQWGT